MGKRFVGPPVRDRALPKSGIRLSEVGLSLGPRPATGRNEAVGADDLALVRHAAERGVRLFDLTGSTAPTAVARRLLAELAGATEAAFILPVVGAETRPDPPSAMGPGAPLRERPSVAGLRSEPGRPGPSGSLLAELIVSGAGAEKDSADLADLVARGQIAAWGVVPGPGIPSLDALAPPLERGASWVRVPCHLLDSTALERVLPLARRTGTAILAVDPFASGRLDGSFLSRHLLEAGPPRPAAIADLRRELGPVTRLGPLTTGRRRTLVQAAVQYVLGWPEVVSVLVETRSGERIDELSALDTVAPLSNEEVAGIGTARSGARPDGTRVGRRESPPS